MKKVTLKKFKRGKLYACLVFADSEEDVHTMLNECAIAHHIMGPMDELYEGAGPGTYEVVCENTLRFWQWKFRQMNMLEDYPNAPTTWAEVYAFATEYGVL